MSTSDAATDETERCPGCGAAIDDSWMVCAWCGDPLTSPSELNRGRMLDDRYRLAGVLGRGGFGITYEAVDTRLGRGVAIKELFPPTAVRHGSRVLVEPGGRADFVAARVRFQREAAALARFSHPGIVRVFEVFEANNTVYLVMELLHGRSLHQIVQANGGPVGVEETLDVVLRVGGALTAVHEAGLLHRDINPSNVMLDEAGRIVLIDFGLARRFGAETATFTRAVTPGYAPPEQYAGSGRFGPACDVYGLAATAYKLLTGVTPLNVFDRQAGRALVDPHDVVDAVPHMVAHAVLDGMELNPDHRPASAPAFLDRLGLHGRKPGAKALLMSTAVGPQRTAKEPGVDETGVRSDFGDAAHADRALNHWHGDRPDRNDRDHDLADRAQLGGGPPVGDGADNGQLGREHVAFVPSQQESASPLAGPPASPGGIQGAPTQMRPVSAAGQSVSAAAPWHDSAPPLVGPQLARRGRFTVPAALAVTSLAISTPTVMFLVVALIALPVVATIGDLVVHRYRKATGADHRRWHRANEPTVVPFLFARNLVVEVMRAIPAAAVGAIGVLGAHLLGDVNYPTVWRDVAVRVTGAATMLCLIVPARHVSRMFRSSLGLDHIAARALDGDARVGTRVATVWVVSVFLVALGLWLHPELWPLPG